MEVTWDFIILLMSVADCFVAPLSVSFAFEPGSVYYGFSAAMFVLDIGFSCITGYYYKGDVVVKQGRIVMQYLTTWSCRARVRFSGGECGA